MDIIYALIQPQITPFSFEDESIPKKNIEDLEEGDFILFHTENTNIVLAKLFGVFRMVPGKSFILNDCLILSDHPSGKIYQVQRNEHGELFLQGIKRDFKFKK